MYSMVTIVISSVQSLSRVRLFATPWVAACQASLSITNSWSLPKLMSIELLIPSNHLILYSFYSYCHRSAVALSYRLKCVPSVQTIASMWGCDTCFSSPTPQVKFQSCSLSSFSLPCIILPSFVWVSIPFQWSGTLAHSQLVFCDIFCIWRCVSDALREKDVLHIHLLLNHLVSPHS